MRKGYVITGLGLIAVLALAFWFVGNLSEQKSNQKKFDRLYSETSELLRQQVQSSAMPLRTNELEKTCTRTDVIFGKGDLSCQIGLQQAFAVHDASEAKRIASKLIALLKSQGFDPPNEVNVDPDGTLVVDGGKFIPREPTYQYCQSNFTYKPATPNKVEYGFFCKDAASHVPKGFSQPQ